MTWLATAATVLALFPSSGTATAALDYKPKATPIPAHCTAERFKAFSGRVWRLNRWNRGRPRAKAIRAFRRRLACARGYRGHHLAIQKTWRQDKRVFYEYRDRMLSDWCSPNPHPEGGGCWVIPAWCVSKESGGSWTADNPESDARGAYQLLGHGEPWPVEDRNDAMAHHLIAAALYAESGLDPWVAC